jgi:hypothetical protein
VLKFLALYSKILKPMFIWSHENEWWDGIIIGERTIESFLGQKNNEKGRQKSTDTVETLLQNVVQFTNSCSLDEWIHCIPTRSFSLGLVNSLNIQWNHFMYKVAFCCSESAWNTIFECWVCSLTNFEDHYLLD